ncbi:MAG: FAD binding domain-containing protein, partial [Bacilli bacterium]|nr:FAD binding domain-containing protein [Bacilli bacterium]
MFTLMELVQPRTLEDAYEILIKRKNNTVIGGSAFLKMGKKRIGTGIDLSNLNLNLIEESSDYIEIGARTTLRDLEVSPILNKYFNGVVSKSVKDIIGVQFRNVATAGASVFSKYGFSDLIVALLALDTELEMYKGGKVKLEEFLNKKYEKDILVKLNIKKNKSNAIYKCM